MPQPDYRDSLLMRSIMSQNTATFFIDAHFPAECTQFTRQQVHQGDQARIEQPRQENSFVTINGKSSVSNRPKTVILDTHAPKI